MNRGTATAASAGLVLAWLIGLAVLLNGCGWFGGDEKADGQSGSPFAGPLGALARGAGVYDIYNVIPNQGPLAGGQQVLLDGNFPSMANAATLYTVYFGAKAAVYDAAFFPVFSAQSIYVLTPPGNFPGFVDVILRDALSSLDTAAAYDGYEYIDPFALIAVDPTFGPLPGGQQVELIGRFPIAANIFSISAANSAYSVYFGVNRASFDTSFGPIVTAERMYVITPPGNFLGLVDVTVVDVINEIPLNPLDVIAGTHDFRRLQDGYEYIDPFALLDVVPDSGPLAGGNPIDLIGRFPIFQNISSAAQAYSAYAVYFGANRAVFDMVNPVITAARMSVIAPPGDMPGLVDVSVEIIGTDPLQIRVLADGYEYLDPFALIEVVPNVGPLAGMQQVEVIGRFPITANISTINNAYSAFRVYLGANFAPFDASFNPIITAERIYIITPPGVAPGLVDVTVVNVMNDLMSTIDVLAGTYDFRRLQDGYEYITEIILTDVEPDNGFILGDPVSPVFNFVDTPVTLTGVFPVSAAFSSMATAADAYAAYNVYFGNRRALFDSTITPVITSEKMYVLAPAGEDVGPVDVRVAPVIAPGIFAELEAAYRYYSMYIGAIIPNFGPLSGGNPVRIDGLFLTDAITNLNLAEQIYTVYFAYNHALFDFTRPPDPVITFASIDTIRRVYVSNSLYVAAPPGDSPGFVDVIVFSDLDREPEVISDPLKYEYIDDGSIGQWRDATVLPNPVGKLPPGHLLVTVTVSGAISGDSSVFIVPQGGNPNNDSHRIMLVQESIATDLENNTIWTGTNADLIDTTKDTNTGTILVDGHAAIFLFEESTGTIIGGPLDDGRIDPLAEQGRHFIIDTIPPRMQISFPLRGGDFIDTLGDNSDVYSVSDILNWSAGLHPFPLPFISTDPIPWDQSIIPLRQVDADNDGFEDFTGLAIPDSRDDRAQIFYNPGSITNNFLSENLTFSLFVTFEDIGVYETLNISPGPDDEDIFIAGKLSRPVAGFGITGVGIVGQGDDVLIKWNIQADVAATPDILDFIANYAARVQDPAAAGGISPNLAPSLTVLDAAWTARIEIEVFPNNMLMPIVFLGVDRAGNYFPRGDPSNAIRKNWTWNRTTVEHGRTTLGGIVGTTTFDQTTGPLNLWWLVNTGTEFLETNIPGSENTRSPNFIWQNSSHPDPETIPEPDRLFIYKLWNTDGTAPREEARDGPYFELTDWSLWRKKNFLATSEIDLQDGAWMLLVVIAADEAGNVEQWPLDDLGDISTNPTIIVADNANSNGNWRRWFVEPAEQVVDTEVRPTFWHDFGPPFNGVIDASEKVLGNIEIVPLSSRSNAGVSVTFRIDVIPDPSMSVASTRVDPIELFREGQSIAPISSEQIGDRAFTVTYVGLGDPITRQPVHYVFRATGSVSDTSDSPPIVDSTPANFKFVVVDNVAKFIEGRGDDQPIKELDRP